MTKRQTRKPEPPPPSCKGWNFHVFALTSDRCSLCGWRRL